MKNKNYQQLNDFKLVMHFIRLRGFTMNEHLTNPKHIDDLALVTREIAKRGYQILERGKMVEFVRA